MCLDAANSAARGVVDSTRSCPHRLHNWSGSVDRALVDDSWRCLTPTQRVAQRGPIKGAVKGASIVCMYIYTYI